MVTSLTPATRTVKTRTFDIELADKIIAFQLACAFHYIKKNWLPGMADYTQDATYDDLVESLLPYAVHTVPKGHDEEARGHIRNFLGDVFVRVGDGAIKDSGAVKISEFKERMLGIASYLNSVYRK